MQERAQQSCHATRSCWFFQSQSHHCHRRRRREEDPQTRRLVRRRATTAAVEHVGRGRHRQVHDDAEEESHQGGANQRGCLYRIERKSRASSESL